MKKLISILTAFSLVISLFVFGTGASADTTNKSYLLMSNSSDRNYVAKKGRSYYNDTSLRLTWSAAGYSVRFYGTELKTTMTADGTSGTLNVYVDKNKNQYYFNTEASSYSAARDEYNANCPHISLSDGKRTYTVVSGLAKGYHTVTLLKRAELDRSSNISVNDIITDGYFCDPPAKSSRKIEIVGDSNATGFGNMAMSGESGDYNWYEQDATLSFGAYCAEELAADYSICAHSGATVTPGLAEGTLLDKYLQTDAYNGVTSEYDFEGGSDVVIIHLGDNDHDATEAKGTSNYVKYLAQMINQVRSKNPNAKIICVLSLAGYSDWHPYVQQAIDASGDTSTYKYLNGNSNNGAPAGHALQKYHKILGLNLAAYIRTLMGWNGKVYETVADTANSNISVNLPQSFYKAGDTVTFTPSVTGGQVGSATVKTIGTTYGTNVAVAKSGSSFSFTMPSDRVLVSVEASKQLLAGDVNLSGKSNAVDALIALKYATKSLTLSSEQTAAGDVNGDGKLTTVDALIILQYSVKKMVSYPVGEYVYF